MVTVTQVKQGDYRVGFATVDSEHPEFFLVTYVDYELNSKLDLPLMFKNIPYAREESGAWTWGKRIATYDK